MPRKVFFSFHYDRDINKVCQIRNSWVVIGQKETQPFVDKAEFEQLKRQGDRAVQNWIDTQMRGTSVTVVLVGAETYKRRWVKYEIEQSHRLGKGMIGISLSGMNDFGKVDYSICPNPFQYASLKDKFGNQVQYPMYNWVQHDGRNNISRWIEDAAIKANRSSAQTLGSLLGGFQ
jgi:hypothetical protein